MRFVSNHVQSLQQSPSVLHRFFLSLFNSVGSSSCLKCFCFAPIRFFASTSCCISSFLLCANYGITGPEKHVPTLTWPLLWSQNKLNMLCCKTSVCCAVEKSHSKTRWNHFGYYLRKKTKTERKKQQNVPFSNGANSVTDYSNAIESKITDAVSFQRVSLLCYCPTGGKVSVMPPGGRFHTSVRTKPDLHTGNFIYN